MIQKKIYILSIQRFACFFAIVLAITGSVRAQFDSLNPVVYTPEYRFFDGIFIDFQSVKFNDPISKASIITDISSEDVTFFSKLTEADNIKYYNEMGLGLDMKTMSLWGYCQNGALYVNWNGKFNRISYVGSICHFLSDMTVIHDNFDGSVGYYAPYSPTMYETEEVRQYVMDFSTGHILDFTVASVEQLLSADIELFTEYAALRKKERKQTKFLYIRKFNEKHPLFLPVNGERK